MIEFAGAAYTVAEVAEIVDGRLFDPARAHERVTSVAVDSRLCVPGSLFVALKGERTDGHLFLDQAAERGSVICFVDRSFAASAEAKMHRILERTGTSFVMVDCPLAALQKLARAHMRSLTSVTRIGITGSNGKTTTKEILGAILAQAAPTAINPGNLNSEIGLPMACFAVGSGHTYAVFEMGVNRPGEMDVLVDIVRPSHAAITNIGTAHVGLLGSVDAIAFEKRKIFRHVPADGCVYLPEDTAYRGMLGEGVGGTIILHGPESTAGYEGSFVRGLDGVDIEIRSRTARLPLVGEHNVRNALCAVSIAHALGVSDEMVAGGLERVEPTFGRGEVLRGAVTIVRDCYNANTESTVRSVDFVDSVPWTGRKILILGSMKELGDYGPAEHEKVGRRAADSSADAVLLFGAESEAAYHIMNKRGGKHVQWLSTYDDLVEAVRAVVSPGDLVLLKGSRSLELERLTDELAAIGTNVVR